MPAQYQDVHFPHAGLDVSKAYDRQPVRSMADGDYARTTPVATNVRPFDPVTDRMRGGSRPGLSKWCSVQLNSGASIQDISTITIPNTGDSSLMKSTRSVSQLTVAGGKLYLCTTSSATLKDATFLSSTAHVVYAAASNLVLYYTDGISLKTYNAATATAGTWTASAGSLPSGGGEVPRLVERWGGRIILSGLRSDPQNMFMSAVGDATDFDYSPTSTTPTQAIAGNDSAYGTVGDAINAICSYNDNILIVGCDHEVWMLEGDLMQGGKATAVSNDIGMAFGRPYCQGPDGTLYFFATRGGIYFLQPGNKPAPFSAPIWARLKDVDTAANIIRLIWDDRGQGFHTFISPLTSSTATTHYFWDSRTGGWFDFSYGNKSHNPKTVAVFDADSPDDRALLIGSWDGYVRMIDPDATTDDGTDIESEVWVGPLLTPNLDEMDLRHMQAVLGANSGDVDWDVYRGSTAEIALSSDSVRSGTWKAGRNHTSPVRRAGHALWFRLSSSVPWAMESLRCWIETKGEVRMRR